MILLKNKLVDYHGMLNDPTRNAWFKKHIQKSIFNKTFVDVGSGTGILSAYALEAGAKQGYLIELSKEAATIGKHVLEQMGYKDKIVCINTDFKQANINNIDVVISEQVGPALFDELQLDIWRHYNKICGSDYVSIPDELSVDLHIYEGNKLASIDHGLINDSNLPNGFYNAFKKISIEPKEVITNFISIDKQSVDTTAIENIVSLSSYDTATLVFVNKIGYDKDYLYLNQSLTQAWKYSPRLFVHDCTRPVRIFWNPDLSNKENPCDSMYKGYWDFESLP